MLALFYGVGFIRGIIITCGVILPIILLLTDKDIVTRENLINYVTFQAVGEITSGFFLYKNMKLYFRELEMECLEYTIEGEILDEIETKK